MPDLKRKKKDESIALSGQSCTDIAKASVNQKCAALGPSSTSSLVMHVCASLFHVHVCTSKVECSLFTCFSTSFHMYVWCVHVHMSMAAGACMSTCMLEACVGEGVCVGQD